ncbi:MAG: class A beta-lactamase-related serine hydrolase [Anaerolineae bacterium]|nr:class A beta-lactamase-related serine hydrolase [Anaerolineae bacterium]
MTDQPHTNHDLVRVRLEQDLASLAAKLEGVLGLGACNLVTGEEIYWNPERIFPQGSTIKILILIELFRQAETGEIDLKASYLVRDVDKVGGAGILKELGHESVRLTVRDLAVLMMVLSDNTASNLLIDLVGLERINQTVQDLGFQHTRLTRRFQDYYALHTGLDNTSTPREMVRLLSRLYHHELVDPTTTSGILDLMQRPKPGEIRQLLPEELVIAHKPGGLNGGVSDAGIVYQPDSPYVIALMTNFLHDTDQGREVLAQASWLVWRYFEMIQSLTPLGARPRLPREAALAQGPIEDSGSRERLS